MDPVREKQILRVAELAAEAEAIGVALKDGDIEEADFRGVRLGDLARAQGELAVAQAAAAVRLGIRDGAGYGAALMAVNDAISDALDALGVPPAS